MVMCVYPGIPSLKVTGGGCVLIDGRDAMDPRENVDPQEVVVALSKIGIAWQENILESGGAADSDELTFLEARSK